MRRHVGNTFYAPFPSLPSSFYAITIAEVELSGSHNYYYSRRRLSSILSSSSSSLSLFFKFSLTHLLASNGDWLVGWLVAWQRRRIRIVLEGNNLSSIATIISHSLYVPLLSQHTPSGLSLSSLLTLLLLLCIQEKSTRMNITLLLLPLVIPCSWISFRL